MDRNEMTCYWIDLAQRDLATMEKLFTMEEFTWSLFMGQLVLEKMLKALYAQNVDQSVPRIHDLARLAILAKIEVPEDELDNLDTISTFNMNARYPDEKLSFYKTCTPEYASQYFEIIGRLYLWMMSLINVT